MASPYNITIKRYNNNTWEVMYPKTIASNIISGVLDVDRIPSLNANKITTGVLGTAQIPSLDASKITTGVLGAAQIPDLDAGKIKTGYIDAARLPAIALTNVLTDTTMANFLATYSGTEMQEGDVLILTTEKKTYIHNGGTAGTVADFTRLATPTDVVTSINGQAGPITLTKGHVGLGSVDNTADSVKNVATAAKWTTERTISLGGDASGSVLIDGSKNVTLNVAVADDSHNHIIDNIDGLQSALNLKQNNILFLEDNLLSGHTPAPGTIAFTF